MFVSFENPLRLGIVLILLNAKQWLRHYRTGNQVNQLNMKPQCIWKIKGHVEIYKCVSLRGGKAKEPMGFVLMLGS